MGLLDMFEGLGNLSEEQSQGLLAMGAKMLQSSGPSLKPTSFGQVFGDGLSAYQGGMQAAQKQRMDQQEQEQMRQLRELQIRGMQGDLAVNALKSAREQRIQQRRKGDPSSMPPAAQQLMDQMGDGQAPARMALNAEYNGVPYTEAEAKEAYNAAYKAGMNGYEPQKINKVLALRRQGMSLDEAARAVFGDASQATQATRPMGGMQTSAVGGASPGADMSLAVQRFAGQIGAPLGGTPQASVPDEIAQPGPAMPATGAAAAGFGDVLRKQAYTEYMRDGQIRLEEGDVQGAKAAYDEAAKFMPKVRDWKEVRVGGKTLLAPYFESGGVGEPVPYEVAKELHFADNGQRTGIGQDRYTGAVMNPGIQKMQSPDSVASTASAAAGRAQTAEISRLNREQAERHYQGGRAPAGFRMAADGARLEAIPGGPADIGKALPGGAVKELGSAGTAVENTRRLASTFQDKFGGKTITRGMSNTVGRIFGDDTGQAQWWQDMDAQQNQTRHELFGSALTATELAAWEKTSIGPEMDPKQIRENLKRRQEIEERAASKLGRAYTAAGYNKTQIGELLGTAAEFVNKAAPPAGSSRPTNAKGWRLMTDANGNNAYVSPDGRQFEEVK